MASISLRTIGMGFKRIQEDTDLDANNEAGVFDVETNGLTLISIVGIKDVLRDGVKESVKICNFL